MDEFELNPIKIVENYHTTILCPLGNFHRRDTVTPATTEKVMTVARSVCRCVGSSPGKRRTLQHAPQTKIYTEGCASQKRTAVTVRGWAVFWRASMNGISALGKANGGK